MDLTKDILLLLIEYLPPKDSLALFSTCTDMYNVVNNNDTLTDLSNKLYIPSHVSSFAKLSYYMRLSIRDIFIEVIKIGDCRLITHYSKIYYLHDALYHALVYNNIDSIRCLVELGRKITHNYIEYTIKNGMFDTLIYLVENGGKLLEDDICLLLTYQIHNERIFEMIDYMLDNECVITRSALIIVIEKRRPDILKYLINYCILTNRLDEYSDIIVDTCVQIAASTNNMEILEYIIWISETNSILSRKLNKNILTNAINMSIGNKNIEMITYLVEKGGRISEYVLRMTIHSVDLPFLKQLVVLGGNISDVHINHIANKKDLELVQFVMENHTRINKNMLKSIINNRGTDPNVKEYLITVYNRL